MLKRAVRSSLSALARLKAACMPGNTIKAGCRFALSADVRHSTLHGHNVIGKRSVVHRSVLGDYSYVGDDCRIINVDVGRFTSIGCDTATAFGRHPSQYLSQHPATYSIVAETGTLAEKQLYTEEHSYTADGRLVSIGHDVWVGDGVRIFDGVTIGHGAVIGAQSLVTRSVPPYAIVRGIPGEIVRYRFGPDERDTLLRLQWWFWTQDVLREAVNRGLLRGGVAALVEFSNSHAGRCGAERPGT